MGIIPDPLGISEHGAALARLGSRPLEYAERQAKNVLRASSEDNEPDPPSGASKVAGSLRDKLDALLSRALEQTTAASTHELYHRILDHLVPDEARILSALSDGTAYPLIHVYARSRSGRSGELLLENACLVGKMANVSLPHLTPVYVSNLLALGVVDLGPEDPTLKDDYLILMADAAVLKAVKVGSVGPIAPPVKRHVLRMSALGKDLWNDATGDGS